MAKRASKLKEADGILPDSEKISRGHKVSDDDKEKVRAFYESDEGSRMCPGRKGCIERLKTRLTPMGLRSKCKNVLS